MAILEPAFSFHIQYSLYWKRQYWSQIIMGKGNIGAK